MSPERPLAGTSIRRPIRPLVNAVLGVLALITGLSAQPAQDRSHGETPAAFKFVRGKGVPVCDAYKKFLDAVADRAGKGGPNDQDRLMCMRQIPAEFAALSQPQWTEINPLEHTDLATQVALALGYGWEDLQQRRLGSSETVLRAIKDEVRVRYQSAHDKWYLSEADIDNDGRPELLVKYRRGRCNPDWPDVDHYEIPIVAFDRGGQLLDPVRTRQILLKTPEQSFDVTAQSFDVFGFQGEIFIDRWENEGEYKGQRTDDKTLSVFLYEGARSTLVCRYRLRVP